MSDSSSRPAPRPVGSSQIAALEFCRDWMVYLGERDTMIASGDVAAVCDLYSSRYVALVQNRIGNIEVPFVQRAIALSTTDGRRALVFHSGGCLIDAAALANAHQIPLFSYMSLAGEIAPANRTAMAVCRTYRLP